MRLLLLSLLLVFGLTASAQTTPVTWNFKVTKTENETYLLTAKATIADTWGLYSQHTSPEGPVPTSFKFDGIKTIGATKEISKVIKKYSDLFEVEVKKFKNEAIFTQEFTSNKGARSGNVEVTFMCCDDLKCLPPSSVVFDFAL